MIGFRECFQPYLSIESDDSQQMDTVNDRCLVELPVNAQVLLQLLLRERLQEPPIHEVVGEGIGILRKAKVWKPLGGNPSVIECGDSGEASQPRLAKLLDS